MQRAVTDHLDVQVPHPTCPSYQIVPLIRNTRDVTWVMSTDRIGVLIHLLSGVSPDYVKIKAIGMSVSDRHIGSNAAMKGGAPLSDI
ncbi:hypothetical protein FBU59_003556, partial [Linderina macrospora]